MSNLRENAIQTGEQYYWPGSALDDFSSDCEDSAMGFEDEDAAPQLRDMIIRHNATLKDAKERVRNFMQDSFRTEEVPFQSDSHPYR